MAKAGISVQQSRFALLKVEGSDDESDDQQSKQNQKAGKGGQQSASAKRKKNKKKKDAESAELRNLAFGGPTKNKGKQQSSNKTAGSGDNGVSDSQWEEWKKMDSEYTADTYQQDLQQAIMQSRLEFELQKTSKDKAKETAEENGKSSKKKNKKKANTMSLEQFNQKVENILPKPRQTSEVDELGLNDEPETPSPPPKPKSKAPPTEPDPEFFNKVNKDASKIIERERIQEQYKKHYVVENARIQQFKDDLSKKDREIAMLRASHEKLQDELKTVKKRNQQLCFIIGQGEMKDKQSVLLELEEIKSVRDELREQVTSMTTELEKERTKVHSLKDEMYKLKESKGK